MAHGPCIVTLIQRFGSALNLNVHLHMLLLDDVYSSEHGRRQFRIPKPLTADQNGFSLNAAVACQPHEVDRLERPSINSSGQVIYRLEHPFRDGSTHVLFSPENFIAR